MITQIVSVSVPERRRDVERDKFVIKDAFLRHVQNNEDVGVPKLDYVKTVRKGIISRKNFETSYVDILIYCLVRTENVRIKMSRCSHCHDRRHSDTSADSTWCHADRRCHDRLSRSYLAGGGYVSSHAIQATWDGSSCHLRWREDQGSRVRRRERQKNVRGDERQSATWVAKITFIWCATHLLFFSLFSFGLLVKSARPWLQCLVTT